MSQATSETEVAIEKCRLDVEGMTKQEAQLREQLAELEAKNPNADIDVNRKSQLEAALAKDTAVCELLTVDFRPQN